MIIEDSYEGLCACCGSMSLFVREHRSLREGYKCQHCRATLRYRGQAELLVDLYSNAQSQSQSLKALVSESQFAQLNIFEAGVSGPFRRYLEPLQYYQKSFFWDDVQLGSFRDGVRCENLEKLTFDDNTFDLMLSSDILEHVRRPYDAFREIHRVLKKGGWHIFSIPVQIPLRPVSKFRVDTTGDKDIYLDEARYHGDGIGGQSLVYIDYGADLVEKLMGSGYSVQLQSPRDENSEARRLLSFASKKHS